MFDPMKLLALPFDEGAVPLPEAAGAPPVPCLRARPSPALRPELFLCEQGARPEHDALAARGAQVAPALDLAPGAAPAVAVALTRNKAENRAMLARAWAACAAGGHVPARRFRVTSASARQPAPADPGQSGRFRHCRRAGPAPALRT